MQVSLIAAMALNRVIGVCNKMPWHIPSDFKYFKNLTLNHSVIMGRKTFESLGKPLPHRRNIVLSRSEPKEKVAGVEYVKSLEQALALCLQDDEVFVIGGEEIYRLALPSATRVYLTVINAVYEGDAFFPHLSDTFKEVSSEDSSENGLHFCWKIFENISR